MSADNLAKAFLAAVDDEGPRLEAAHGVARGETRMTSPSVATVEFDGNGTVLSLACDRGEIDATLALAGPDGQPFRLSLLLGLAGVEDWRTRWPRIIGADTADRSVRLLVGDVVDHLGPWLRGDADALERLAQFRDVDLALKMAQFGPGRRPPAEWNPVKTAWERQDVTGLLAALAELTPPLRDVEEKALDYAGRWQAEPEPGRGPDPGA